MLVADIKKMPSNLLIYNNVKSDLIMYMVTQSMFLTADEASVKLHQYLQAAVQ